VTQYALAHLYVPDESCIAISALSVGPGQCACIVTSAVPGAGCLLWRCRQ
jgi:hypothetical protein